MKKILVAIDGSEHSMRALMKAKDLALKFDSDIELVHVVEEVHLYNIDGGSMIALGIEQFTAMKDRGETFLNKSKQTLSEFGDRVTTQLLEGDPSYMLIDYIKNSDADLVVVGSHGVKGLRKYMMGSVVNKLVHHIDKSILIVR